ncbi:MAG: alpha/beta fold hydrolase [Terracidiphilus sp.]|jgi:alpha/beta superfamily hydrolase
MDSTTASAQTEAHRAGQVFLASQKAVSQHESCGMHAAQLPSPVSSVSSSALPRPQDSRADVLRSLTLAGPAGQLEAVLNQGPLHANSGARFAALICHPHPLGGGNLHNKVVYHAMKVLNDPAWGLGWPVLRFNFRGTGLSEGAHDGVAETGDVLAGMDWLEREFRLPLIVVGFSFGAAMALQACCQPGTAHRDVRALIALGLPTTAQGPAYQYSSLRDSFLQNLTTPKLFLSGDHDRFAPAEQLTQVAASAAEPKRLILIPGADHFFTDQLEAMQRALAGWLKEQLP